MLGREFEAEVLRVARSLWPRDQYSGAINIEGLERDGIFETEDAVHYIECTVDRTLEKARKDAPKLKRLLPKLSQRANKPSIGWWITQDEPTAHQREEFTGTQIRLLTLQQFRAQHIDSLTYLQLREQYPFGSVRNPDTGETRFEFEYTELTASSSDRSMKAADVAETVGEGKRAVVLGDYGAGKSTFARQVFRQLCKQHRANRACRFPIYLNLRDHGQQEDPVEALHRHARALGFGRPEHLIRAWRGGWCTLILDGFDEIAPRPIVSRYAKLTDYRRVAMSLVRSFVEGSTPDVGILIAGRLHYFDNNESELSTALGLRTAHEVLRLSELSDAQLRQILGKTGVETPPSWFPTKPLLVAYLTSRGFTDLLLQITGYDDASIAWDYLIGAISERESRMEVGLTPDVVRSLMERVACRARVSSDGLGAISESDLSDDYNRVCGALPDERGMVVLQRLPGLGAGSSGSGVRSFVDRQIAEALQSRPVAHYATATFLPYPDPEGWSTTLSIDGQASIGYYLDAAGVTPKQLAAAIDHAYARRGGAVLASDLILGAAAGGLDLGQVHTRITEVWIREAYLTRSLAAAEGIALSNCVIEVLEIDEIDIVRQSPLFVDCEILSISGRASERDLPDGMFEACTFSSFEEVVLTTAGLKHSAPSMAEGVLMTILKKLYLQAGKGRQESALLRGLDTDEQRYVPDCLEIVRKAGLASPSKSGRTRIWYPTRGGDAKNRVLQILTAPRTCHDATLAAAAQLR